MNLIRAMERVTIGELKPDLTIILDVPAEVGLARAAKRRGQGAPDRFEAEDINFHRRLRDAYRQVAIDEPERCILIDATTDLEVTARRVWNVVGSRFVELREAQTLETNGA
jgi:dTMP kinase